MKAKILSMNIGHPAVMEWEGKKITSSMKKSPVAGPLVVHTDRIEGNIFAHPQFHGTPDSVLYAYGLSSAAKFMALLGGGEYLPGTTGETLTLDHFEETEISVGDKFQIGEVVAQATYPRIPCGKLIFRMQHPEGQKAMQDCRASGVYFKILAPGLIQVTDSVERIERAAHPFLISDLYAKLLLKAKLTPQERRIAEANEAFPPHILAKLL